MSQFAARAVVGLMASLAASVASAQPGPNSVVVAVRGADVEFVDLYDFQEGGILRTGGIEADTTVFRQVAKEVQIPVTRPVLRFVNGRLVIEMETVYQTKKVFETVEEHSKISLPPIQGRWFAGPGGISVWTISAAGPSGAVFGWGTKIGATVAGNVNYLTVGNSPPSGLYVVSTEVIVMGD